MKLFINFFKRKKKGELRSVISGFENMSEINIRKINA